MSAHATTQVLPNRPCCVDMITKDVSGLANGLLRPCRSACLDFRALKRTRPACQELAVERTRSAGGGGFNDRLEARLLRLD